MSRRWCQSLLVKELDASAKPLWRSMDRKKNVCRSMGRIPKRSIELEKSTLPVGHSKIVLLDHSEGAVIRMMGLSSLFTPFMLRRPSTSSGLILRLLDTSNFTEVFRYS